WGRRNRSWRASSPCRPRRGRSGSRRGPANGGDGRRRRRRRRPRRRRRDSSAYPPGERVPRIDQQRRFAVDVGLAADARDDAAALAGPIARLEDAADDALLFPDLTRRQFAVGGEAGELGAGAGAARRAVVGQAGAEDEVAAVRERRGAEQLDVIDLAVG